MTNALKEIYTLAGSEFSTSKAYLDLCPPVYEAAGFWTSQISECCFDGYTNCYSSVVLLTELLNQFAIRCARNSTLWSVLPTHHVPALITGLRVLNPMDISGLVGRVSIDNNIARVVVVGKMRSGAKDCNLATITVLELRAPTL
jgi:hypothetical protein